MKILRKRIFLIRGNHTIVKSLVLLMCLVQGTVNFESGPGCGGLISNGIVDLSISASRSSEYNSTLGSDQAFINNTLAWCTGQFDFSKWFQIGLGKEYNISALATQEWPHLGVNVNSFTLLYKQSGGASFISYTEGSVVKTFTRSPQNKNDVIVHNIQTTRMSDVKFTFPISGVVCLRLDIYGCWKVNGNLSNWGSWGSCNQSCGGGTQTRERTCTNPAPANGGLDCNGPLKESRYCNSNPCSINGNFSSWTNWSNCSSACGNGTQTRNRTCSNPAPAYGGAMCTGKFNETTTCFLLPCNVDGNFSSWTSWTNCSSSCGNGAQTRNRTCSNPAPAYGGALCNGKFDETKVCFLLPCKVDGNFSAWTSWSKCSSSCGNGTQTRNRTCSNPVPAYGGALCIGTFNETKTCFLDLCKDESNTEQQQTNNFNLDNPVVQLLIGVSVLSFIGLVSLLITYIVFKLKRSNQVTVVNDSVPNNINA